ncbi:MAG: glycosyltransferase N-terminal domain-containing protein, partial [Planctomycetota bacterium]|nr:glycosyltransferase N-terminal domain-containing protein [Planctomycetota bacterium]
MKSAASEPQGSRGRSRPRRRLRGAATMLLYQVAFLVGLVGYAPVLLWRGLVDRRYWHGFGQRMGYVDLERTGGDVVWIHGVSVGEVKAANNIIERLRELRPELQIVLSSTTPNGHHIARLEHPDLEVLFYPLDFGLFP